MTASRSTATLSGPTPMPAAARALAPVSAPARATASRLAPALASMLLLVVGSVASASGVGRLDVTVTGVSAASGLVGCALFASKTGFPFESRKHAVSTVRVPAAGGVATCSFEGVAPGEYAVAVVHDTNGNEQLDTNMLGMPTEGVGVSNNALPRLSPPTFEACRFVVAAGQPVKQTIAMKY